MPEENRTTYRCASPSECQKAVVKINGRDTVVHLCNQSAGGFLIEAKKKLGLQVGDTLLIRTGIGWSEVRVIHKQAAEGETRWGLERCVDLPDPRETPWTSPRSGTRRSLGLLAAVVIVFLWSEMFAARWFSAQPRPLKFYEYFSGKSEQSEQPTAATVDIL